MKAEKIHESLGNQLKLKKPIKSGLWSRPFWIVYTCNHPRTNQEARYPSMSNTNSLPGNKMCLCGQYDSTLLHETVYMSGTDRRKYS